MAKTRKPEGLAEKFSISLPAHYSAWLRTEGGRAHGGYSEVIRKLVEARIASEAGRAISPIMQPRAGKGGGSGGARTRNLCRDRAASYRVAAFEKSGLTAAEYADALRVNGLAESSIRRTMTELRGSGVDVSGVRVGRILEHHRRALTHEEERALLSACDGEMRTLIGLGLYAGLRLGDALRVDSASVRGSTLAVTQGKTGKAIEVPICAQLSALMPGAGPWMPTLRAMYERAGTDPIDWRLSKLWSKAGITWGGAGTTFHSLRHTYATRLAESGAPQAVVMALCGHRSVGVSLAYQHISAKLAAESVNKAFAA